MKFEFKGSRANSSLFYKIQGQSHIYILIYVDDKIITGNNDKEINNVIELLNKESSLKDLRKLHHCLGLKSQKLKKACIPIKDNILEICLARPKC